MTTHAVRASARELAVSFPQFSCNNGEHCHSVLAAVLTATASPVANGLELCESDTGESSLLFKHRFRSALSRGVVKGPLDQTEQSNIAGRAYRNVRYCYLEKHATSHSTTLAINTKRPT